MAEIGSSPNRSYCPNCHVGYDKEWFDTVEQCPMCGMCKDGVQRKLPPYERRGLIGAEMAYEEHAETERQLEKIPKPYGLWEPVIRG